MSDSQHLRTSAQEPCGTLLSFPSGSRQDPPSLRVRFVGGPEAGRILDFGHEIAEVRFGRDPSTCNVVLPVAETRTSREHCALQRGLNGHYRLATNGTHAVFVNGRRGQNGQTLPREVELVLGRGGPRLLVTCFGPAAELPPTVGATRVAIDTRTRWSTTVKTTRLAALAAGVLAIAAIAIAFVASHRVERADLELATTSQTIDALRQSKADRAELEDALVSAAQEAANGAGPWPEIVAAVMPSVCSVEVRDSRGRFVQHVGTAWVVDRAAGALATNAHVAEVFDGLLPGRQLVARTPGIHPRTFSIASARQHPAYSAWKIRTAAMVARNSAGQRIKDLIQAADVGLLFVRKEDCDRLPSALPLASPEEFLAVQVPEPAVYVGYPSEDLSAGGFDPERPQPVVQVGEINKLTDFFNAAAEPERSQLIHYSMSLTGGASGSPILDRRGRVVGLVCAANFHFLQGILGTERRIPAAVDENFGQRVDLLLELLHAPDPEALATGYRERWDAEFARRQAVFMARFEEDALLGTFGNADVETVAVQTRQLTDEIFRDRYVHEIDLPTDNDYLLLVLVHRGVLLEAVATVDRGLSSLFNDLDDHMVAVISGEQDNRLRVFVEKMPGGDAEYTLKVFRPRR